MSRLEGKIALVTGAGGGIGRAICEQFLAQGARVAALDIDLNAATEATSSARDGDLAISIRCDVGDSDNVLAAISQTQQHFGAINVLCNVAGGSTSHDGRVTEAEIDEFWRVVRLDMFGTFLICRHGIPELVKAGGGSIINLTSMAALMSIPDRDCYTMAKGGVAALTRSMATGYAGDSIRVNAIAPGITMSERVRANMARNPSLQPLLDRHLLGAAEPIDIAQMAVYLASDESRVVTGQVLSVDSGVTIH